MPFFLVMLALLAATTILGELLRPKIKDNAKPSRLDQINFPTADESRAIPVVWGTVKISGPNVTWYGDYKVTKKTKRIRSGLFTKSTITEGFRYHVGLMFALCHGRIDALLAIEANEKTAWSGSVQDGTITVNNQNLFGGEASQESQGEGGVYAKVDVYSGTTSQAVNSYLAGQVGGTSPAYREIAYLIWNGPTCGQTGGAGIYSGYIGTQASLKPMAFIVKRLPNVLSQPASVDINSGDANPAEVLAELFLSTDFGAGIDPGRLDLDSFRAAATTLKAEGIGFSAQWDSAKEIASIADQVLTLIDGVIYSDMQTGLFKLVLIRPDYELEDLYHFDEDNVAELISYSRGALDETTNQVRVGYVDRFNNFNERVAAAFELANSRMQDATIATNVEHLGISNGDTGNFIAYRDLRTVSTNLAKVTLRLNREGIDLRPGSVFLWSWAALNQVDLVLRVGKVRYGEMTNGVIEVECVEDIFSIAPSIYSSPSATGWVDPVSGPTAAAHSAAQELPYWFDKSNDPFLITLAVQPNGSQHSFDVYAQDPSGEYRLRAAGCDFSPSGTLVNNYGPFFDDKDTSGSLIVAPTEGLDLLINKSFADIQRGENLILIDQEWFGFESVSVNGSGQYVFSGVYAALFDTTPQAHSAGARVWFPTYGAGFPEEPFTGASVSLKYSPQSGAGGVDISGVSALSLTLKSRALRPLPPAHTTINSSATATTIPATGDITLAWTHRDRTKQTNVVKQFDASTGREAGSFYDLKIYNESGTLISSQTDITANSFTFTNAAETTANGGALAGALTFVLFTVRDNLESYQAVVRKVTRGAATPSSPTYAPGGTYSQTTFIGGQVVAGSAPAMGQVPIADGAGKVTWGAPSATIEVKEVDGSPDATGIQILEFPNGTLTISGTKATYTPVAGSTLTAEDVMDIVGAMLADSASLDFTYNDGTDSFTCVIKSSGVAAGTYGDATHVPQITIGADGRVTSASSVSITGGGGGTLAGDVTGSAGANTVEKIRGRDVKAIPPAGGGWSDDFDDNTTNTTLYTDLTAGGGSVSEVSTICRAQVSAVSGGSLAVRRTSAPFDFTGGDLIVRVSNYPGTITGTDGVDVNLMLSPTAAMAYDNFFFSVLFQGGSATIRFFNAGTYTFTTFSSTNHRWLRIKHNSGSDTIEFYTAPDSGTPGVPGTWTLQRSVARGALPITNVYAFIGGGSGASFSSSPQNIEFDYYSCTKGGVDSLSNNDALLWNTTNGRFEPKQISSLVPVSSVHGRTGAVVAAANDYSAAQVTNTPAGGIVATNVQNAINQLDTGKINTTARGAANGVASLDGAGKVPLAQIPTGTTSAGASLAQATLGVAAMAAGAAAITGTLSIAKGFIIQPTIIFDQSWRLRLYKTLALRTADLTRSPSTALVQGAMHGCITDIWVDPSLTFPFAWEMSPERVGSNGDSPQTATIYYVVENLTGAALSAGNIVINYVPTEV